MIQLFRLIVLSFWILGFCFSKALVPINETIDTVGKDKYYKLDKDGISYNDLGDHFSYGDSVRIKLFFRHVIPSDFEGEKEFKAIVSLNQQEPYTITYEKEISKKQGHKRKGWAWTKAGVWVIDLDVKDFNKLLIGRNKAKDNKIIVRAQVNRIDRKTKYRQKLNTFNPINRILKTKIVTKKAENDTIISYYYKLSDPKKPKHFEINGPIAFQLLTRLENPGEDLKKNDYTIFVKEDGVDIGTYFFNTESSQVSKVSSTGIPVGKWRSCFINVPEGKHYYSIYKGKVSDNAVYIRLKEHEIRK